MYRNEDEADSVTLFYVFLRKIMVFFNDLCAGLAVREGGGDAHATDSSGQPADGAAQHLRGWT
jgi:hypothetical protein